MLNVRRTVYSVYSHCYYLPRWWLELGYGGVDFGGCLSASLLDLERAVLRAGGK